MRHVLVLVLVLSACGKRSERSTTPARDTVPITITTSFPGASPAVIAESVTAPLERQLGQAAHLQALHSRSTEGSSIVIAEFAAGTDVDVATQDVQAALNAASKLLPPELPTPPTYTRASRKGAVLRLTVAAKELSLLQVARFANDILAQKLSQVAGVGSVDVCGPEPETRITVDPTSLAASGKTIVDVRTEIASASATAPVGSIDTTGRTLSVKTSDDPVADYRNLPIVRDTARVESAVVEPSCVAIAEGARVVAITVTPQVGAEPLEVRERLEALIPTLNASAPIEVHVDVWPRTKPFAYEVLLGSGMSVAARIDRFQRAFAELRLATRWLVQFGGPDREPDVADLRIVPESKGETEVDHLTETFHHMNLHFRDPHDHIVGFTGPDAAALRKHSTALAFALSSVKSLNVVEELGAGEDARPVVTIDRDRAAMLGVTMNEIATTLRVVAPGGMWVATTFTQLSQARVMLRVDGQLPGLLDQVMLRSSSGTLVPLSAVASVTETREPTVIFHEGQFPWVGVRIAGPLEALNDVLAKLPVPADIQREVRDPD